MFDLVNIKQRANDIHITFSQEELLSLKEDFQLLKQEIKCLDTFDDTSLKQTFSPTPNINKFMVEEEVHDFDKKSLNGFNDDLFSVKKVMEDD